MRRPDEFDGTAARSEPTSEPEAAVARVDVGAIERDCRLLHDTASAAAKAAGVDGVLGLLGVNVADGKAIVARFPLGDIDRFVERGLELAQRPSTNVYRSLVLMRHGLRGAQRGTAGDVIGVFGLCCDLDADHDCKFDPSDAPLPPGMVVQTSVNDGKPNHHVTFLFSKLLSVEEAKPIAWALALLVGDTKGGTSDVIHMWRPAGTLNWPNKAKEARGRHGAQAVRLVSGTQQRIDPAALVDALEVALEDRLNGLTLSEAYAQVRAGKKEADEQQATQQQAGDAREASANFPRPSMKDWNGDPHELNRYVDATRFIDPAPRDNWYAVGEAICGYLDGSEDAYRWWRDFSRGSNENNFRGASHLYEEAEQRRTWDGFIKKLRSGKRGVTMGTVVHLAQKNGWKSARGRYGLAAARGGKLPMGVEGQAVAAAGAAFCELPVAKRHIAKAAFPLAAYLHLRGQGERVRDFVAALTPFINEKLGYSWVQPKRLSKRLGIAPNHLSTIARQLKDAGLLVYTNGRQVGPNGEAEWTWALVPPNGQSWAELVEEHLDFVGHEIQEGDDEGAQDPAQAADRCKLNSKGTPSKIPSTGVSPNPGSQPLENPGHGSFVTPPPPRKSRLREDTTSRLDRQARTLGDGDDQNEGLAGDKVYHATRAKRTYQEIAAGRHGHRIGGRSAGPTVSIEPANDQEPTVEPIELKPMDDDAPEVMAPQGRASALTRGEQLQVDMADFNAKRDIASWLNHGAAAFPSDVLDHVKAAHDQGKAKSHLEALGRLMGSLFDMDLDFDQIAQKVADARSYALQQLAKKSPSLAFIDGDGEISWPADRPAPFLEAVVFSLTKRVEWARGDIASGKLVPARRSPVGAAPVAQPSSSATGATDQREKTIADWERQPTYSIKGTIFSNRHAAQLARALPTVSLNEVEAALGRASRGHRVGDHEKAPSPAEAWPRAVHDLLAQVYGEPASQLRDGDKAEATARYVVVPRSLVDEVASTSEPLRIFDAKGGLTFHANTWAREFEADVGLDRILSWYGRGLQQSFEQHVRTKLVEMAERLAAGDKIGSPGSSQPRSVFRKRMS